MTSTTPHAYNSFSLPTILISPNTFLPLSLLLLPYFLFLFFSSSGSLPFLIKYTADFLRFCISRGPLKRKKQEQKEFKLLTRKKWKGKKRTLGYCRDSNHKNSLFLQHWHRKGIMVELLTFRNPGKELHAVETLTSKEEVLVGRC